MNAINEQRASHGVAARVLPRRIERRIFLARALLVWEYLWGGLWVAIAITGLFSAAALMGLFVDLPLGLHWALIAGFTACLATALWRGLKSFRWPDRAAALHHLEGASGLNHQPLSAYEDLPAPGSGDLVLWRAHQAWITSRLSKLKLGTVAPGLVERDPYGLRAIVVLLLVIGIAGTGNGRLSRLAGAFFPGAESARAFTIEAWITPPAYTGLGPIYLERGETDSTTHDEKPVSSDQVIKVPAGSTLSLRAHGLRNGPSLETGNEDRGRPEPLVDLGNTNYSSDTVIKNSAEFALTEGGRLLRGWTVETIADQSPKISFAMPLQQTASGSLHFAYKVSDDYGVKGAEARVTLPDATPEANAAAETKLNAVQTKLAKLFRLSRARATVTPPVLVLPLKSLHPKDGQGETYIDLTSHPWAGLPVLITLVAKDDAGNEGTSAPIAMTLPARTFTKPLAAAIIEQRRALAFHPTGISRTARVLDDLSQDGDRYIKDTSVYIGMRAAYWRLMSANRDEDLTGIYDLLWSIALKIEDGDLSLAEADMRRARDALTKALASGANSDEISHLVDELRAAFKRYMDAVTTKAGTNPDAAMMQKFAPQDGQTIDRETLEKMLGQIGNLARNGSREDAEKLLAQMQAIMENMKVPDQNQAMSPSEKAMANGVDKMTALIDKQRALMDKTFKLGTENNVSPTKHAKDLQSLMRDQENLRKEFSTLMDSLDKAKVDKPESFAKANEHMNEAGRRLGNDRTDRAAISQGEAIANMRAGAQGLVDKLAQGMSGRTGQGSGQSQSRGTPDPFGRLGKDGNGQEQNGTAVPSEINRQRARAIIEDLRRRANELNRPQIELDYFDRLLNRF